MQFKSLAKVSVGVAIFVLLTCIYKLRFYNNIKSKATEEDLLVKVGKLYQTREDPSDLEARRKLWKEMKNLSLEKAGERIHRLPDVIGIGVQKCGTGALSAFLNFHPFIRTDRAEGNYYGRSDYVKGLQYYKNKLPDAADHEIVMEKTPSYFVQRKTPQEMHKDMPNVKLILLLCDPVQRALSAFAMMQETHKYKAEFFESFIERQLIEFSKSKNLENLDPVIKTGIYSINIDRWIKEYDESDLMIINGEDLLKDPGIVIERLQDYIGIPKILKREDFARHPETGMFCVRQWWDEEISVDSAENLQCLSRKKGRSRSKNPLYTMTEETAQQLRDFYQPYNKKLYKILGRDFGW